VCCLFLGFVFFSYLAVLSVLARAAGGGGGGGGGGGAPQFGRPNHRKGVPRSLSLGDRVRALLYSFL